MDFQAYVRSLGLDPLALTPEQNDALEAAWRASIKTTPASPAAGTDKGGKKETLDDIVATAQAEADRKAGVIALIQTYLAKAPDRIKELEAVGRIALEGGWSVKDTEYHLLKQCYANAPMAYVPSSQNSQVSEQVLEASVCRAMGMSREVVEKSYSDKVLSAADRHFRGGCGLQRLLVTCAQANGVRDAHVSDIKRLLAGAFAGTDNPLAAHGFGPSTYSVSGILSNVANKAIKEAFLGIESTWRRITATRPVTDFKQITSYALTGDLTYGKVGPSGEVKHGTFGEETYSNQADLYGLVLGLSYKDIRNDDLGAFAKLSRRMGRGGALKINEVFWTEFLAGQGTFWASGNGNYYAGTNYAFTLDKLGEYANVAWAIRTDPSGDYMADEAMFLLVPPALEMDGREYMTSTEISNDNGSGSKNPLAGKWQVVMSRYLQDSNITGYSASNYFLVADPASESAVIETVFLDGQEMPTVEAAEPDLTRLGILLRGMHAFGVTKQEKRGAIKFKQTAD